MFKFKGISSKDMQVVVEEEEHFIAKASQRYEMTEIEGRDGAIFDELGYSVVERPIYVQCLNINKIDDILAWLNGEGEFEYKGRKTTARFYSQLEPQRSSCIRIIDTTFIRDPFWCKVNEDYQLVKDRKDKKASGEYIHVEDSSNCRAKIGIGGNHEQETRNGKNKIDLSKCQAKKLNGVTSTYNKENNSITFDGTCTSNNTLFNIVMDNVNALKNSSTLTAKWVSGSATGDAVARCYDGNWQQNVAVDLSQLNANKRLISKTYNDVDDTFEHFDFRFDSGTVLNNFTVQLMLTDKVDTDYEMYGASPSPNYLSEIKTVGDNVNLFPGWESGTVDVTSGEKRADPWYIRCKDFIPIVYGVFYTISQINSVNFNSINCSIRLYDKDKKYLGSQYVGDILKQSLTFTVNNLNVKYIIPTATNGKTVPQNAKTDIKLEKGTVATSYSSHGQGNVKITKYNKNLAQDVKYTNQKNKYNGIIIATYTLKKGQKYYFSFDTDNSGLQVYRQTEKELGLKNASAYSFTCDGKRKTFSAVAIENKTIRASIIIRLSDSSDTVISLSNFMISTYEDATYEENQEQTYIMPTQAEMLVNDYLDYDNEEEVHVWGKKILTGDEGWRMPSSNDTNAVFTNLSNTDFCDFKSDTDVQYCNYFKYKGIAQGFADALNKGVGIYSFYSVNKYEYIVAPKAIASSVNEWKVWLKSQYDAGTPVMIYYKLQTPTRLKFTNEQKAVAKELNNARTYKNVTNITTDSKAILSLDYFTVTDEKIKNEGNVQSRPILRLEKTVSEAVDITINGVRFKYNFNNDKYVEIDCENKEVKFDGLERFRSIEIGYDFPKLNIGNNEITMNDGDCIIKVIRKDRWL